jgi:hypothetical protein
VAIQVSNEIGGFEYLALQGCHAIVFTDPQIDGLLIVAVKRRERP